MKLSAHIAAININQSPRTTPRTNNKSSVMNAEKNTTCTTLLAWIMRRCPTVFSTADSMIISRLYYAMVDATLFALFAANASRTKNKLKICSA